MERSSSPYLAALKYRWLTPLYDPLVRWTVRERAFKRHLVEQVGAEAGQRVLDIGCGTGTLALLIKRASPEAAVVGIDADPGVLEIAKRKADVAGVSVELVRGDSSELPYPDGSFDRVVSSLLFHHLTRENKRRTLREALRVLRRGGELHVADWGKAGNFAGRVAFIMVQLLDGFDTTSDNVRGLLPTLITEAGFENFAEHKRFTTPFGTLALYRADKRLAEKRGAGRSRPCPV
jgi:SAM-dependent methyltransferase